MTNQEAIDIIKTAIAEVEWDYPMDYAAAFDMAIEALKEQAEIVRCKDCKHHQEDICEVRIGVYDPDWFCADGERQ